MQNLVGRSVDEKPRPFENAVSVEWGEGSCYINAALQVLFSSPQVRQKLAGIVCRISPRILLEGCAPDGQDIWSFCTQSPFKDVKQSAVPGPITDEDLALTFAAAMQGENSSGKSLRGRTLVPALCLSKGYQGPQDDAGQFLTRCVQSCCHIKNLFRGVSQCSYFKCHTCNASLMCGSHNDEKIFTTLQINGECPNTGVVFRDVQEALDNSFVITLDDNFTELCPYCQKKLVAQAPGS